MSETEFDAGGVGEGVEFAPKAADPCAVCGRAAADYSRPDSGYWDNEGCAVCGRGPRPRGEGMAAAGGWAAPSAELFDLFRMPDLTAARATYPKTPIPPPPPPTLRQRWRILRERIGAVRTAIGRAWKYPDGWWEED